MKNILLTGSTSGLGRCIFKDMRKNTRNNVIVPKMYMDIRDEQSVINYVEGAMGASLFDPKNKSIDILINCAGVNHIDWFEELDNSQWDECMEVNAKGIWLLTRELINQKKFSKPATIVNIISNASHIPMTNSAVYNASKGAAHILTLQMARELKKRHDITVFGISPNKLKGTGMSKTIEKRVQELRGWTPEEAEAYQLNALPAGKETDPDVLAEFIAFLLSSYERHEYLNGCIIPYGA